MSERNTKKTDVSDASRCSAAKHEQLDADDPDRSADASDYDDNDFDPEHPCHTCGGDGFVDSVAEESGRWGWDEDEPGQCPNCNGSGLAKDCWYW